MRYGKIRVVKYGKVVTEECYLHGKMTLHFYVLCLSDHQHIHFIFQHSFPLHEHVKSFSSATSIDCQIVQDLIYHFTTWPTLN